MIYPKNSLKLSKVPVTTPTTQPSKCLWLNCSKTFDTELETYNHFIKCHCKKGVQKCLWSGRGKICNLTLRHKGDIKSHAVVHFNDIKPIQCAFCGDRMKNRQSLHRHKLVCKKTLTPTVEITGSNYLPSPEISNPPSPLFSNVTVSMYPSGTLTPSFNNITPMSSPMLNTQSLSLNNQCLSPMLNTQCLSSPMINTQCLSTPMLNSQCLSSPMLSTQCLSSPMLNTQCLTSPVVNTQWFSSPMLNTQCLNTQLNNLSFTNPHCMCSPLVDTQGLLATSTSLFNETPKSPYDNQFLSPVNSNNPYTQNSIFHDDNDFLLALLNTDISNIEDTTPPSTTPTVNNELNIFDDLDKVVQQEYNVLDELNKLVHKSPNLNESKLDIFTAPTSPSQNSEAMFAPLSENPLSENVGTKNTEYQDVLPFIDQFMMMEN
ncbi:hypothetical protein HDU92_004053 [Lobulomyces angularis]|nr:hypothetical protein HDU92_004053 [Lobulomyces angularis]